MWWSPEWARDQRGCAASRHQTGPFAKSECDGRRFRRTLPLCKGSGRPFERPQGAGDERGKECRQTRLRVLAPHFTSYQSVRSVASPQFPRARASWPCVSTTSSREVPAWPGKAWRQLPTCAPAGMLTGGSNEYHPRSCAACRHAGADHTSLVSGAPRAGAVRSLRRDVILGIDRMQVVVVLGDTVVTIVNVKFHSNSFCNLSFISPGLRNAAGVYHSRSDKRAMYILPRDKATSWGRM